MLPTVAVDKSIIDRFQKHDINNLKKNVLGITSVIRPETPREKNNDVLYINNFLFDLGGFTTFTCLASL